MYGTTYMGLLHLNEATSLTENSEAEKYFDVRVKPQKAEVV